MRKFKSKIAFCIKRTGFLAVLAISIDANAAGFDCSKASTSIEKMICNDRILSDLDSAMSNLYSSKKDDKLKEIQLDWIKNKETLHIHLMNCVHYMQSIFSFYLHM